jgi:hypothetical protein
MAGRARAEAESESKTVVQSQVSLYSELIEHGTAGA